MATAPLSLIDQTKLFIDKLESTIENALLARYKEPAADKPEDFYQRADYNIIIDNKIMMNITCVTREGGVFDRDFAISYCQKIKPYPNHRGDLVFERDRYISRKRYKGSMSDKVIGRLAKFVRTNVFDTANIAITQYEEIEMETGDFQHVQPKFARREIRRPVDKIDDIKRQIVEYLGAVVRDEVTSSNSSSTTPVAFRPLTVESINDFEKIFGKVYGSIIIQLLVRQHQYNNALFNVNYYLGKISEAVVQDMKKEGDDPQNSTNPSLKYRLGDWIFDKRIKPRDRQIFWAKAGEDESFNRIDLYKPIENAKNGGQAKPKPRKNSFESMTVKVLRRLASERNITGYSTMLKDELISALRNGSRRSRP
jgi:hypothetical protein